MKLKSKEHENDDSPLEDDCGCYTCKTHTRKFIHRLMRTKETVGCHLLSIHNIAYQMKLMRDMRNAISQDTFPDWVRNFMKLYYSSGPIDTHGMEQDPGKQIGPNGYPIWITNALNSVGIELQ